MLFMKENHFPMSILPMDWVTISENLIFSLLPLI